MATINSGSSNPTVWIVGGKAYSDNSHGGYKTNYYNAVKKLGQNLGWNVKAGSKSAANLAAQNKKFNSAGIKTVTGKKAVITSKGLAAVLTTKKKNKVTPSNTSESTWTNGWKKVGQGFKDWASGCKNAYTNGNKKGWYSNITEGLGGTGRMALGLGEATVGTLFNSLAPDSVKEIAGKYGQVADIPKLMNSANKLLQGLIMAPWDEKNKGFVDNDWSWMGNERDRENWNDTFNGATMILGTKGMASGLKSAAKSAKTAVTQGAKLISKLPKTALPALVLDSNLSSVVLSSKPVVSSVQKRLTGKSRRSKLLEVAEDVPYVEIISSEKSVQPALKALPSPESHLNYWGGNPKMPIISEAAAAEADALGNARWGKTAAEYAKIEKLMKELPELF